MIQAIATPEVSTPQDAYLQTWMEKVSRSFALMVPWLEPPLNRYLATAYLLCRVADNIEDCWQPAAWKRQRFAEADELLERPRLAPAILNRWQQESWPGLITAEQQMMGPAGEGLWQIYTGIPQASRTIIRRWIGEMITGMSQLDMPDQAPHFVERRRLQVLAKAMDYNRYCYIVAGTVGYMSTELVIQQYRLPDKVARRLLDTCEACGRSLQKINIVKDFARDLERRVCYLPDEWLQEIGYMPLLLRGAPPTWTRKVFMDILDELEVATDYLTMLPYQAAGYRMAGLLSLLPTYQTLLLAAHQQPRLFTGKHHVKISRLAMAQCIWDARSMVSNNQAVRQYSRQLGQAISATFN